MSEYNIQMHNYNGSSYDNLYPKTKSTIVIMNDGKTVEEAMASGGEFTADSIKLKVNGSYDDGWTVQDWYDGNIVDPILDNNSFATIRQVSDAGTGASYWSVGDRKAVTFTSGAIGNGTETKTISGTWYMSVLGFNHNNEGGIHFQFGWTALTGGVQIAFTSWTADQVYGAGSGNGLVMNSSNTNVGGWPNSLMRGTELGQNKSNPSSGSFMYLLPSDLRNVMRSVTKTTNTGNNGGTNTETSTDYLWLPSEVEVFGSTTYSGTTTGQAQYDYYKGVSAGSASKNAFTAAGKVRYGHDKTSRAVVWWERSPGSSYTDTFCVVNYGGDAYRYNAFSSRGIAPCLCI